jgi:integrase
VRFKKKRVSGGGPSWPAEFPRRVGKFRFRRHKNIYWEGDGGQLHKKKLRVYGSTPAEVVAKAKKKQREINEHGQHAIGLSTAERWEMVSCLRICKLHGISPLEACEEYAERHKGTSLTFLAVIQEVVASKRRKGRVARYVDALERELLTLEGQNPGKLIGAYLTADLERELQRHPDWQPTTVKGAVQSWNVVFNHAVKFEYRKDNPCKRLELPRVVRKEPTKLTIAQMQRGLAVCLTSRDMLDCLAWFVLGCFAGLRPEEIEQLRWEQVSFETKSIIILANTSKRRTRRVVTMQPVLLAWLRPLFREHGRVMSIDLKKVRPRMRKQMGFTAWPADISRHTFASYHFHKWHNLAETRYQMGHEDEEGPAVFFNHYCALVVPPDQDVFWELMPPWKEDLDLAAKYMRDIGWTVRMQLRTLALPAPSDVTICCAQPNNLDDLTEGACPV